MPRWPKERVRGLLARGAWFSGLPGQIQDELLASGRVRRHARGSEVYVGGDPPSDLHALLEGAIEFGKVGEGGNEVVLNVCRPGYWFGTLGSMAHLDSGITARAVEPVTLLSVPPGVIQSLFTRDPDHLAPLLRLPMRRYLAAVEAIEQASRPTARNRLAAKLLALDACQEETDHAAANEPLPISQATLAAMTRLSRQMVNRILRDLEQEGVIGLGFRAIRIVDRQRLRRAAAEA